VEDWIKTLKRVSARTRAALRLQLECDQAVPVGSQSLLGLLAAVRGGCLTDLFSRRRDEPSEFWTEAEVYRCTGGNGQLAECMKREIEEWGGRVLLSTIVTKIDLSSEDVSVCANGNSGRWVVVVVPPSYWDGIEFPFKTDPYRIAMGRLTG
jgi:monoamine oxidase